MEQAPKAPRFLEPIYLNDKMVLNSATYLLEGVSLEYEETTSTTQRRGLFAKAGIPFLSDVIGLSGGSSNEAGFEGRAHRQFTVGGLHMNVLDKLYDQGMVNDISDLTDETLRQSAILDKYLHAHVILRATDYWSTLQVLSMSGPLLHQLAEDYGDVILNRLGNELEGAQLKDIDITKYLGSVETIVQQLINDYLTSGQLEMVMWSDMATPFGVLELNVEDYEPEKLKAALVGGKYHVFGKVTARVLSNQKLSLLQRISLFEIHELFVRLMDSLDSIQENTESHESQESIKDFQEKLNKLWTPLQKLIRTELHGPVIRMLCMSVCV